MNKGFTLLELIIVIIIVAVLASLALPRMFKAVEQARSAEAMAGIASIRRAIEVCALWDPSDYGNCILTNWRNYTADPGSSPNAHFNYYTPSFGAWSPIMAVRNSHELYAADPGGDIYCATGLGWQTNGHSAIAMCLSGTAIKRVGSGFYSGVK